MRTKKTSYYLLLLVLVLAMAAFPSASVNASHSWGNYHWARTSNPFTLKLGDNMASNWDPYLVTASGDWNSSAVLDTTIVAGSTTGRRCRATAGRVEVCNASYGQNGWLGLASIWANGSHITQGTAKMNDTYFSMAQYNTPAWRQMVVCQEVAHTFGLDHQDEDFNNSNLGTCMDYTSNPGTNQHPNQGDYDQLLCIYDPASFGKTLSTPTHSCTGSGHLDSTNTVGAVPPGFANADMNAIENWGEKVEDNGHTAFFVKDFGDGYKIFTFVIWATE